MVSSCFCSIRYDRMTPVQLVTDVEPHVRGKLVPHSIYLVALSQHGHQVADKLSAEQMFSLWALAAEFGHEAVFDACFVHFAKNANTLLGSSGFHELDMATVLKIVQADHIQAEEVLLFRAVVRWCFGDPSRSGSNAERLLHSIRYERMTGHELIKDVGPLIPSGIIPRDHYIRALQRVVEDSALLNDSELDPVITLCHHPGLQVKTTLTKSTACNCTLPSSSSLQVGRGLLSIVWSAAP